MKTWEAIYNEKEIDISCANTFHIILNNSITKAWLWFKSYLSNRLQSTKINDEISDPCTIKYGIPQGTVLGPILLTIYVNNLLKLHINGNILAVQDDTVLDSE